MISQCLFVLTMSLLSGTLFVLKYVQYCLTNQNKSLRNLIIMKMRTPTTIYHLFSKMQKWYEYRLLKITFQYTKHVQNSYNDNRTKCFCNVCMWCVARFCTICTILKIVKNTHGGVHFFKTKSDTPTWVFFTFFKLYKWYKIAQCITYYKNN